MKLLFNIFSIFLILFINGCSSKKLTIKSLHSSKIGNEKINTIKVEDFNHDDIQQTISIKNEITNKVVEHNKVFILKNDNNVDGILNGDVLDSSLDVQLYYKPKIDYSRCKYYKYDEKNKIRHCVEYLTFYIPCEKREYNVKTNITLTKVSDNSVIFSKTYNKSIFDDFCHERSYYPLFPDLSDKFRVNAQIAIKIAEDILNDISPHYIYYNLEIIDDLDENNLSFSKNQEKRFEDSIDLMEKGSLELAKMEFEKLDKEFSQKSFTINYNLGLIYEAYNKFEIANEFYKKAKDLTLDINNLELVNSAIIRTQINLEEKNKAKLQLQNR